MLENHKCECSVKGYCNKFKRTVTDREIQICNGTSGVSEVFRHKRLLAWSQELRKINPPKRASVVGKGSRPFRRTGHWSKAFSHECVHLGEPINGESGKYFCNLLKTPCRPGVHISGSKDSCVVCSHRNLTPKFIKTSEFVSDIHRLATMLPEDITAIAGVSRSGLFPASLISMLLHLKPYAVRQVQGDVIPMGNGWRLQTGSPDPKKGRVCVIDDTVMTGNSINAIRGLVKNEFGDPLIAAVYVNPLAVTKPDIYVKDLPWPHFLEWNIFNSVILPSMALDFDGILCHDCPPADDDDGPRYLNFLRTVRPLYPVRRQQIPLVVTARLEKYRQETMNWLNKWGISVGNLIMGPWSNNAERARNNLGVYKGKHFRDFMGKSGGIKPCVFVESDRSQAMQIARYSRGCAICPATGECFNGRDIR